MIKLLHKIDQLKGNFTTHDGVIVLTYHRINNACSKDPIVVNPGEFKKQMLFLNLYRKQFQVIGVGEMVECLRSQGHKVTRSQVQKIVLTFDDGWEDNYTKAFPVLKKYGFKATIFLTASQVDRPGYLTSQQIKEMSEYGIEFGAHSVNHPRLTQIPLDKAKGEIIGSYKTLRNTQYARRNTHLAFCYPHGDYDGNIKAMVKEAGFSCAFSVNHGINYQGQDLFEIKRIDVLGQDNFASFKYKLTDKYEKSQGHKVTRSHVEDMDHKLRALMYHSIGSQTVEEIGTELYCVPEVVFRAQMEYLRNTQYAVRNTNIIVTFDDGDLTNYTTAYPILKEMGLSAYFFILISKVGTPGYMNWVQIKELKDGGMVIGSHGITHRILTALSDKELDYELKKSKKLLEDRLGDTVDCLSIPRGFYNEKIINRAKQVGYKAVFTSNPKDADGFRYGRISVRGSWGLQYFTRVLNNGYSSKDRFKELVKNSSKRVLGAKVYDLVRETILR